MTMPVRADVPAGRPSRAQFIPIVVVAIIAFAVGFAGSWIPYGWTDEAATLTLIKRPLPELWATVSTHVDAVHALYYFSVKALSFVLGSDLTAVRAVSAVGLSVTAVGVWATTRLIGDARAGVLAALALVTIPSATWAADEARSYAWVMAFAAWLTWSYVRVIRDRKLAWVVFTAVAVVSVYLFVYLLLVVLALLGSSVLTRHGRHRLGTSAVSGAIVVFASLPVLIASSKQQGQISWIQPLSFYTFRNVVFQWFYNSLFYFLPAWALIIGGVVILIRSTRSTDSSRDVVISVLAWLILPTAALLLVSLVAKPVYLPRYTLVSLPAAAVLIGIAARRLGKLGAVAVVVLAALSLPTYIAQRTPEAKRVDWGADVAFISSAAPTHAGVYFGDSGDPSAPRQMLAQYGTQLAGLRDLALAQPGARSDQLWDSTVSLQSAASRSTGLDQVFVITDSTSNSLPGSLAAFEATGLQETARQQGQYTTVVELVRPNQ